MSRLALICLALTPLLAGCVAPGQRQNAEEAARSSACRADAERVITRQDRGQLMRAEEADARGGTGLGGMAVGGSSMQTETLAQRFAMQRMTADCVRGATPAPATPNPGAPRGS